MRISDWSSDVCSSDLPALSKRGSKPRGLGPVAQACRAGRRWRERRKPIRSAEEYRRLRPCCSSHRSEEHTSELQSLLRISYAVFCLKKKNTTHPPHRT